MPHRITDTDEHEIACHNLHHSHDKRLTLVEAELDSLKDLTTKAVGEVCQRQKQHEDKFDATFNALNKTLQSIEVKLESMVSSYLVSKQLNDRYIKIILPISLAVVAAFWTLYKD